MKQIDINTITFGNPTQEQLHFIKAYIRQHHNIIKVEDYPFPKNDSLVTIQELNNIVDSLDKISMDHNSTKLDDFLRINENLDGALIGYFKEEFDFNFTELIDKITQEFYPLIYKLKYYYNRPRPYQLASILKLNLFPFQTTDTPSYPCGDVLLAKLILKAINQKHPELKENCDNLVNVVATSKIFLGQNYQSDIDFSFEIADEIIKSETFKEAYLSNEKTNDANPK